MPTFSTRESRPGCGAERPLMGAVGGFAPHIGERRGAQPLAKATAPCAWHRAAKIPTWVLASGISPASTIRTACSNGTRSTSRNSPRVQMLLGLVQAARLIEMDDLATIARRRIQLGQLFKAVGGAAALLLQLADAAFARVLPPFQSCRPAAR